MERVGASSETRENKDVSQEGVRGQGLKEEILWMGGASLHLET